MNVPSVLSLTLKERLEHKRLFLLDWSKSPVASTVPFYEFDSEFELWKSELSNGHLPDSEVKFWCKYLLNCRVDYLERN